MRSFACASPSGAGTNSLAPLGASPRSAMMFSTPASCSRSSVARSSATDEPTQVRCAIASTSKSRLKRETRSSVRWRVLPPAPYVTETNVGLCSRRRETVSTSWAVPSSLRGGKNSNENEGNVVRSASEILIGGQERAARFLPPDNGAQSGSGPASILRGTGVNETIRLVAEGEAGAIYHD